MDRAELTCTYDDEDAEPTCPKCGHYNAMLSDPDGNQGPTDKEDRRKCRDCGAKAIRV